MAFSALGAMSSVLTNKSNVSINNPLAVTLTGQYITYTQGSSILYAFFSGSGTIQFSRNAIGSMLMVGGGGGGGWGNGGAGGGSGGVTYGLIGFDASTNYTISIGQGGAGGVYAGSTSYRGSASSGANTTFIGGAINETANGGGYGGSAIYSLGQAGADGGSGGGGCGAWNNSGYGTKITKTGSMTYLGNNGSPGIDIVGGGGGGGATAVGGSPSPGNTFYSGGKGGDGFNWTTAGTTITVGGGGGGGSNTNNSANPNNAGLGGLGGGGAGARSGVNGIAGTANTGGGGGGASLNLSSAGGSGGAGGSGVFIIALPSYATRSGTAPITLLSPTSPIASVVSATSASVAFTLPSGSIAPILYAVTSSPGAIVATGKTTPIVVSGLTSATSYTFTVTARYIIGVSSPSTVSSSITTSAPSAPTGISASRLTNTSASIAFTPPSGIVTSYTVTSNPGSITGTGSSSPITVSGLSTGTTYTFTVTATNAAGTSPASTVSSSITTSAPSAPTGISASLLTNTSASIAFTPPSGTVTSYTVTSNPGSITGTGSSSPIAVTGLTTGTSYTFTVTATNAAGTSPASTASASFTMTVPFSASSINGLQLWLDGADPLNTGTAPSSGTVITSWSDKSGSSNNFAQATGSFQPIYGAMSNGKTAVNFASSKYMTNTTISVPTTYSIFVVGYTGTNGYGRLLNGGVDGALFFGTGSGATQFATFAGNGVSTWNDSNINSPATSVASLCLMEMTNSGTSSGLLPYVNGTVLNAKNGTTVSFTTLQVGSYYATGSNQFWNGYVAEILIYNSVLSATNRQVVEGYLAWKWGIQASLPVAHPYYSYAPIFGPPSAPTALTVTVASATSLSVAFTPPTGLITSYTVTSSPGSITATGASSPIVVSGLTTGTAYTFTVTATGSYGTSPASVASASAIPVIVFGATSIAGLQLWLDAADPLNTGSAPSNGSTISTWYDKSGSARNATATGTVTYNTTAFNSKPAMTFGSSQYFTGNVPVTGSTITTMAVYTMNSNTGVSGRIIGMSNAIGSLDYNNTSSMSLSRSNIGNGIILYRNTASVTSSFPSYSTPYLVEAWFDGTSMRSTIQVGSGTAITTVASTGNFGIAKYVVGNSTAPGPAGEFWNGYISEIIVYNTSLSTKNRQVIEGYLSWKWGIQANLPVAHPYYNAAPTFGVPSAPTAVTASIASAATSLSVAFTEPNGLITSYTVTSSPGSITGTGSSSPIVVSGLTTGTAYTFTVTATNSYGTSPASAASASFTTIASRQLVPFIWYKFNDTTNSGTGGSAYNGTLVGTSYTVGPSTANGIPVSGAGRLTATGTNSSWFSVPSWTSTSAGITICFWVYPLTAQGCTFCFGTTTNQWYYMLEFFSNQYYIYGTATDIGAQNNGPNPALNTWTHYAFVHGTTQTKFYVNGSLTGTTSWNVPVGTRSLNYIGNGFQNATGNPNSYITDFEIHTTTLTDAQVLSIYQATSLT